MSSSSARFSVAVHILSVLGYLERRGEDGLVGSEMIARSVNTNPVVIRSMLRALKKAGLVYSKEGRGGGVRLARRPGKISLQEIYAAVEENGGVLARRQKPAYSPCPVSCGMQAAFDEIVDEVDGAVARALRGRTLADVVGRF